MMWPEEMTKEQFDVLWAESGTIGIKKAIPIRLVQVTQSWSIKTREGELLAEPGDYIAEGLEGEIYPIGESIFEKTYVVVPPQPKEA